MAEQEMTMDRQEIKAIILKELPRIVQTDEEVRRFIVDLGRRHFMDRDQGESRFDQMMGELVLMREESEKRWKEGQAENRELIRDLKEFKLNSERRKEEHQDVHKALIQEIRDLGAHFDRKFNSTMGAIGTRWGLHSEASFRNALKGILEEHFNVEVISVNEFDDKGEVFGRPDQIELDIIIRNGELIICELKSSISRSQMHTFANKAHFYEKKHGKKASGWIVISPMVDPRAKPVAEKLGITVYTHADDVENL